MTLRDYFAAKALQGLLAGLYAGNNAGWTVEGNCKAAYEYADAMLAAGCQDHDFAVVGTEPCGGRVVLKCSVCGATGYRERNTAECRIVGL